MPELVDLVRADGALRDAQVPVDVGRGGPKNATPAPAKVIFEVDPNTKGRSGLPPPRPGPGCRAPDVSTSVRWCTAYALSQKIRKSGAAVSIAPGPGDLLGVDRAVGVAVLRHAPDALDRASSATSSLTASMSGPSASSAPGPSRCRTARKREVPVVAGDRADERDLSLRPTAARSRRRLQQREHDRVVHDRRLELPAASSWSTGT